MSGMQMIILTLPISGKQTSWFLFATDKFMQSVIKYLTRFTFRKTSKISLTFSGARVSEFMFVSDLAVSGLLGGVVLWYLLLVFQ